MILDFVSKVSSQFFGLVGDIIKSLTILIFKAIVETVMIILKPLNAIILTAIPGTDTLINYISNFFDFISGLIPWAVSYLGLDPALLSLIVGFIVFRISTTLLINMIKFGVLWYKTLKP